MSLSLILRRFQPFQLIRTVQFVSTNTHNAGNNSEEAKAKKPKTAPIPKITLIGTDQVSVTTLEEAKKLSKRRDLKLVKILDIDTKTQRPVYKLMTGTEYHEEDLKQRQQRKLDKANSNALKGEKVLILNPNISEHDLLTDVNKISKWLGKRYEVRVVINGIKDKNDKVDSIYSLLENKLKDLGKFVQKRTKGTDVKFEIVPLKPPS